MSRLARWRELELTDRQVASWSARLIDELSRSQGWGRTHFRYLLHSTRGLYNDQVVTVFRKVLLLVLRPAEVAVPTPTSLTQAQFDHMLENSPAFVEIRNALARLIVQLGA